VTEDILDQPVWNADEMAKVLGRTKRQVFHMLHSGHIDASRIGGRWVSTRRRLLKNIVGGDAVKAARSA
jgi:excisionase family DNA binding protein